jgi:hypothetical protein
LGTTFASSTARVRCIDGPVMRHSVTGFTG